MTIPGVQIIYRLRQIVRLFIDYRDSVDSFNLYFSDSESGPFTSLLSSVPNIASTLPSTRGKVVFEFSTESLISWNDNVTNYVTLSPVVSGIEGIQEGPMTIPTRIESLTPKEYSVMYGFNKDSQKFIPVAVDVNGNIVTTIDS